MEAEIVFDNVRDVAAGFATQRVERQTRRHLDRGDFNALASAGFPLVAVPVEEGGLWRDLASSTRTIAELLRTLAMGDPSVALVSAMHPAVAAFWLCQPGAPTPYTEAWAEQTRWVVQTALDGHFWGTITSEPGSGGDVGRTKATAKKDGNGGFLLSGEKHFGSGSGIASYMVTTAIPEGESEADWFFLDTREAKWDGSNGMTLRAEWDGHGMTATQSHSFVFSGFPATRLAWPGNLRVVSTVAGAMVSAVFVAVVYGTVQSAVEAARKQIMRRKDSLAPYETVEWVRVENEAWLMDQAYQGMLSAIERKGSGAALDALQAKTAISELAESVTQRLCRIAGGGSFLRPPWVLAYDQLIARVLSE
jgi:alkylation response protein AidB-like acyl-CoA dehydrogenase